MKYLLTLFVLLSLFSCGKGKKGSINPDAYYSLEFGGIECKDCVIIEIGKKTLTMTYTGSLDFPSCSGKGSLRTQNEEDILLPVGVGSMVEFQMIRMSGGFSTSNCFPDTYEMIKLQVDSVDPNKYLISFYGLTQTQEHIDVISFKKKL